MAEGDNHARFTNVGVIDRETAGGVVKGNPRVKNRLPEQAARDVFYADTNQKDVLPEHTARRTTYPHINAQ